MNSNAENKGLVSLIIPVYKTAEYLDECLSSVTSQTYNYLEIIIVLDGEDETCLGICNRYANSDERIQIYCITHQGTSAARNYGLRLITGDYVAFIDSDDCLHPLYVETLLKDMINQNADISCCNYGTDKSLLGMNSGESYCVSGIDAISYCRLKRNDKIFYGTALWNKMFRVSNLQKDDVFDVSYTFGEDTKFLLPIMAKSTIVSFSTSILYYKRMLHNKYSTHNIYKYYSWEYLFFVESGFSDDLKESSKRRMQQYFLFSSIHRFINGDDNVKSAIEDNWSLIKRHIINDKEISLLGRLKLTLTLLLIRYNFPVSFVSFIYNLHD